MREEGDSTSNYELCKYDHVDNIIVESETAGWELHRWEEINGTNYYQKAGMSNSCSNDEDRKYTAALNYSQNNLTNRYYKKKEWNPKNFYEELEGLSGNFIEGKIITGPCYLIWIKVKMKNTYKEANPTENSTRMLLLLV